MKKFWVFIGLFKFFAGVILGQAVYVLIDLIIDNDWNNFENWNRNGIAAAAVEYPCSALRYGSRPAAHGMYFMRIAALDIDEIRKVMVIK